MTTTSISVFELDDVRCGIALADTREVFRMPAVTHLPQAPAVIEGIVNIRGRIVPVFDLRRRFGLAERPPHPADHLLYATAGTRAVALRADRVTGIAEVPAAEIEPALTRNGPFTGVAKLDGGLILLHDLAAFLGDSEAEDLDRAMAAAKA